MQYEKEVIEYLNLPSLPKKEWDGKSSFGRGVAVIELRGEGEACAVASFDSEKDSAPRIVKVFGCEPFRSVKSVFVVPNYMAKDADVDTMDLDEESKKKAKEILKEADEIENDGVADAKSLLPDDKEYYFDNIHNDEEGRAFIEAYNKRNKIKKGRIPTSHTGIVMRLAVIYSEMNKQQ